MSNAQILDLLHELRLAGFREELDHQLQNPQYSDMPPRTASCGCCRPKRNADTATKSSV
jgi:hypothetical protein